MNKKPSKQFLIVYAAIMILSIKDRSADACSAFFVPAVDREETSILAANYDWKVSGGIVFTNPRGLSKKAFLKASTTHTASPVQWTAIYSSVTLTQWGKEFPVQGMNTRGLSGVVLNAPATYSNLGTSGAISELQWLQFQLDNYATVHEIVNHVRDLTILPISGSLHYFFCDVERECVVVEFASEGVQTYIRDSLPTGAVTNSPYRTSIERYEQFLKGGGTLQTAPQSYATLDRFIRAAWTSEHLVRTVDQIFSSLKNLAGLGWTQWNTVFDSRAKNLVLGTGVERTNIRLDEFDSGCDESQGAQMRVVGPRQVSTWQPYKRAESEAVFVPAATNVQGYDQNTIDDMLSYPETLHCNESFQAR